jgi:AbrB family looped-hinge helix DNA binding protein
MTRIVSVTKKGQATIPKDLRERFGVGDKVLVVETEDGILFKPLPRPGDEYVSLKKLFPGKTAREVLEEVRERDRVREEELSRGKEN